MTPQPEPTEALRQAIAAAQAGQLAQADLLCRQILAGNSADPGALCLSGALAAQRGDITGAISDYRAALAAAPRFVKALSNLGAALSGLQRFDEAAEPLRCALEEQPDHGPALINLGQVRLAQGRVDEAVALLRRATECAPQDAMAWNNLGAALLRAEKLGEAEPALRQALALEPRHGAAWSNLGHAHFRQRRPAEAAGDFRQAFECGAAPAEMLTHLGAALRAMGRPDEAMAAYERALQIAPDHAEARFARALLRLADGQLAQGWDDYRARPSARAFCLSQGRDTPRLPVDLTGRKIFLAGNQGFGDELFFLRYAPGLKARGARISYRPGAKLAPLLRSLAFIDEWLAEGAAPAAEMSLLIDDLPYALGENGTPPPLALRPEEDRLMRLRERLAALGPAPYLGLTWRGGLDRNGALFKEAPLAAIAQALRGWPGTIVALQRAPNAGEIAAAASVVGAPVHNLTALNDDLAEMLALLALLDDYVAVSNTNVHLRQSLGLPSRVLVPMPPDWRWMAAGDSSPWFPGSRVYRQTADGAWDPALGRLSQDLKVMFSSPS